jgi:predicted dehydrogenase
VRWGLVGTGGIVSRIVSDLRLCPETEITAVTSRKQESADTFAREFGVRFAYENFDLMCQNDEVDAVYIGTPHSTHFEYAKRAILAGKHVLCEKPMTLAAEESAELSELAKANQVFLMEAMWMKFTPAMKKAMQLITEGSIGKPMFLQSGLGFTVPKDGPMRFWDPKLGGGALYDLAIYPVTLAQMIFGEVKHISVTGSMRNDGIDLHEAYTINYSGGETAQLVTAIDFFVPTKGWLGGTEGTIEFNHPLWCPRSITVSKGNPPKAPVTEDIFFEIEGAGYVPMFREVNRCILAGDIEHPLHPVASTVESLRTLEYIHQQLQRLN